MSSSLTSISDLIGKQLSFDTKDDGTKICRVAIFPCADLFIKENVTLEMTVTRVGDTDQLTVKSFDESAFRLCRYYNSETKTFSFPYLESRWYALSVWFYAVRNHLLIDTLPPWRVPETIKMNFPINPLSQCGNYLVTDFICGAGRLKGRRPYMEDVDISHTNVKITDTSAVSIFGVFDGHGGQECSAAIAEDLPSKLTAKLRMQLPAPDAIYSSFVEMDQEFIASTSCGAGSTANLFLWDPSNYIGHMANTGDTRSVLCRAGIAVDLTRDQKATDPDEIVRISKAGGFVSGGRVLGLLAVARAFGDSSLKTESAPKAVTAEPEILSFRPLPVDEFIVMATDGLWDVFSSQDSVDYVSSRLVTEGIDLEAIREGIRSRVDIGFITSKLNDISESLASAAIQRGSQDNVTVMILLCYRCAEGSSSSVRDVFTQAVPQDIRSNFGDGLDNSRDSFDEIPIGRRSSNPPLPTKAALSNAPYSSANNLESLVSTATESASSATGSGDELMDFLTDGRNFDEM